LDLVHAVYAGSHDPKPLLCTHGRKQLLRPRLRAQQEALELRRLMFSFGERGREIPPSHWCCFVPLVTK
jgi:hypothetical protein